MIVLFLLGYTCIAMEHKIGVNKTATALLLCSLLWTCYIIEAPDILPARDAFQAFVRGLMQDGGVCDLHEQVVSYVTSVQIIEHAGDVASTLFFLMGAMTIVELIDAHNGFNVITKQITTKNKRKLLWMLSILTFFMSAVLDNLTTTIVMVMLLRKLVTNFKERWLYACVIVIAANAGGAFSPIGDVTTIMLWVRGNITSAGVIPNLIIPSILALVIPVLIAQRFLKGTMAERAVVTDKEVQDSPTYVNEKISKRILIMGIGALVFVPIFKSITHLPPFVGILLGLGFLWIHTERLYKKCHAPEQSRTNITNVLSRIDLTTIMFFLGILMAVAALQDAGILGKLANFLDEKVGNVYVINIIIGVLSSIVDNVPLVAGSMGMYDLASATQIATDPSMLPFAADGAFWLFLAYCAGVGGSILIIGSAAGVVVMGLEKVNFVWYLKNISLLALSGYLVGAAFFILQEEVLRPLFGL